MYRCMIGLLVVKIYVLVIRIIFLDIFNCLCMYILNYLCISLNILYFILNILLFFKSVEFKYLNYLEINVI